jgi:hypothetical protein
VHRKKAVLYICLTTQANLQAKSPGSNEVDRRWVSYRFVGTVKRHKYMSIYPGTGKCACGQVLPSDLMAKWKYYFNTRAFQGRMHHLVPMGALAQQRV